MRIKLRVAGHNIRLFCDKEEESEDRLVLSALADLERIARA